MRTPPDEERCAHHYADGRRCRGIRGHMIALCPQHQRAEQEQQKQLERRMAAAGEEPAAAFANSAPAAAVAFLARARDYTPGSVFSINTLIEQVLQMVVDNKMSARTATACAQLLRLMLKAQPQVEEESAAFNAMIQQQREIEAQIAAQPLEDEAEQEEAQPAPTHSDVAAAHHAAD